MAFNAEERTISKIFTLDGKYTIPRYQRKYVWDEKQWRELFEDLLFTYNNDLNNWSHFLGSFVFEENKKENELIVIDGQQRITTCIIMLCVVSVIYNELDRRDLFEGVKKYILGTNDLGEPYIKVDNPDLENFQTIVAESTTYKQLLVSKNLFSNSLFDSNSTENKKVKQCFYYYYNMFKEVIDKEDAKVNALNRLKEKILSLNVIEIIANDEQESYNIFEILNARGVDLEQHELLKNYIFKYITPKGAIDIAKKQWSKLENLLYVKKDTVFPLFLNHYTTHKYSKPDKDNSEFRIIKSGCSREKTNELLLDLNKKAEMYRWFYIPTECNNEIVQQILKFFNARNHRQFRPLILSLLSAFDKGDIDKNSLENSIKFLRNFYFAYGIVCKNTSNTIEKVVYEYSYKIENEYTDKLVNDFISELKNKYYPQYNTFENSFINNIGYSKKNKKYSNSRNKKDVQFVLMGFENYWQSTNELSVNEFSIEHIASDDGLDLHCKIGNLLPLAGGINQNVGTDNLQDKIVQYKESNFISVKKFIDRYSGTSTWEESKINNRARQLAKIAYEHIWKV